MRLDLFFPCPSSPGRVQRALRRFAPTWGSSPVRRGVQLTCLVVFLWIFFYVCWPYGAADYAATRQHREKIAAETFEAKRSLIYVRTVARALAKGLSTHQLKKVRHKPTGRTMSSLLD